MNEINETSAVRETMIRYVANREWIRRQGRANLAWFVGTVKNSEPFPTRLLGMFNRDTWYPIGVEATADVPAADDNQPYALIEYCATSFSHIMAVARSLSDQELVEAIERYASYYDRNPLAPEKVEL